MMERSPIRIVVITVIVILLMAKVYALFTLPMIGDEPDDLSIIAADMEGFDNFFSAPDAYEFEQARLPFYISIPFIVLFPNGPIVPLRLLFFIFYLGCLLVSYHFVRFLWGSRDAALAYVLLLSMSCFLASFSVFSITTGDSLYLLLHILSIYTFMKIYRRYTVSKVLGGITGFILLCALCIASKLFGVLLLVALFLFFSLKQWMKGPLRLQSGAVGLTITAGVIFLTIIVIINLVDIPAVQKTSLALGSAGLYLFFFLARFLREVRGTSDAGDINYLVFWIYVFLTVFCLTIIFSPVYLNLRNLISALGWFGEWNRGQLISNSNLWDMPLIILMKYGVPSSLILILTVGVLFRTRGKSVCEGDHTILLLIVFIIHVIAITLVKHKVTWYPLAVFPFLYLPLVALGLEAKKRAQPALRILFLCAAVIVLSDNAYRYARWYPYGHFDGAQYGREYIGWNRAGFISFEVIPPLTDFLISRKNTDDTRVNCQVVEVRFYNSWFRILLEREYSGRGGTGMKFFSKTPEIRNIYDYYLSSPIYYPQFEETLEKKGLDRLKMFTIKGIDLLSVWEN